MSAALDCRDITKTYGHGPLAETVLDGVSLTLPTGAVCAVVGPSGSGKTTLLSILGCLLSPTSGNVSLQGEAIDFASKERLIETRRTQIGFVFQHAQLLPFLNIAENLSVVATNCGVRRTEIPARIADVAGRLGITDVLHKKPTEVSGGQRQRAAIARAVLHRPPLLLADEPTAALDWKNGQAAVQLLIEQARLEQSALITVTHDTRLLDQFEVVLALESGRLRT
jgi:putative ABC transport system ATP-binding protein